MGIGEDQPFRRLGPTSKSEAEYLSANAQKDITTVCDEIKRFLIAKNSQYGNSAIDPVRIFSKASTEEQLKVRIDDKISRLVRGNDSIEADDDIVDDLIGYLIMWKVASRRQNGRD